MRLALIAIAAFATLFATAGLGSACPEGYAPCGSHYCCPR
jgi:hypothetical protein